MPNVHSVRALYSYTYLEVNIVGFCYCCSRPVLYCVIQFRFCFFTHSSCESSKKKRNIRFWFSNHVNRKMWLDLASESRPTTNHKHKHCRTIHFDLCAVSRFDVFVVSTKDKIFPSWIDAITPKSKRITQSYLSTLIVRSSVPSKLLHESRCVDDECVSSATCLR